jgi:hypothetical protein
MKTVVCAGTFAIMASPDFLVVEDNASSPDVK